MELKEINLGPLITDDLDRAQIPGNICQSAFSIFNNGWHCCKMTEGTCTHHSTKREQCYFETMSDDEDHVGWAWLLISSYPVFVVV